MFPRSIDDKHRIAVPKRIRDALKLEESSVLYITRGTDSSLAIYTEETLAALAERLAPASPNQHDVRAFNRLFYAQAEPAEIDSQGRIRVPPSLAELAGLDKEIVLLGVQDHLELWDRAHWDAYCAKQSAQYDEIAERAFNTSVEPPK
ncbi:MAG TPA: division/cell wall cluster transcriptional repressor MraZ [Pirellulales bacterium]|nr:division/cell wall cluster transcriptional repressor MraZ [Pirellulales bacterium]